MHEQPPLQEQPLQEEPRVDILPGTPPAAFLQSAASIGPPPFIGIPTLPPPPVLLGRSPVPPAPADYSTTYSHQRDVLHRFAVPVCNMGILHPSEATGVFGPPLGPPLGPAQFNNIQLAPPYDCLSPLSGDDELAQADQAAAARLTAQMTEQDEGSNLADRPQGSRPQPRGTVSGFPPWGSTVTKGKGKGGHHPY